jgi:anti-anti-sigma factor
MPQLTSCSAGSVENGNLVVSILEDQIREAAVAYRLRDEIIGLIDQQKPANIVLELANVKFIGSVGFLAFLGVRRHLGGGRIILCNLSDAVRDVFSVCRLIPTQTNSAAPFEVANDAAAALAQLSGQS